MLDTILGLFSHDVGIDLGTANTLVWVRGKGIVVREPSVVARHKKTKQLLAIGTEAKRMLGKTPATIEALRPLQHGVIADFDAAEAMLKFYIRQVHEGPTLLPKVARPRVVVGIPSGVTEVERRAVQDAALSAGARQAWLIEEPMAAAIGAGVSVEAAEGQLVVDIGGGTTEIAVIALGGIVIEHSVRIAGDEMDQAVINFARLKYNLIVGEISAEGVKLAIGSAYQLEQELKAVLRGRDLETGLPKSVTVGSAEIREALAPVLRQIMNAIVETIEQTPPELVADILQHGIIMAGGGSLLRGVDKLVAAEVKMPVWVTDDPLTAVVRGCGIVLETPRLLAKVRVVGGLR